MHVSDSTVLTVYAGPPRGGCYERLQRLVGVLADRRVAVHYVGVVPPRATSAFLRFHPIGGASSGEPLGVGLLLRAARTAASIARREDVRSIFCFGSVYAALLSPLRLRPGTRLVTFLRGDVLEEQRAAGAAGWRIGLVSFADRLGRLASHHLVSVSRDLLGRDRGAVLPNEPPRAPVQRKVAAEARSLFGLPQAVPLVGYCGAVAPVKSLETLVDAMVDLKGAHLTILGIAQPPSRYEETLATRAANRLKGRWHPRPWSADAASFLDALDVFVLPSRSEGSSNVLLEALARGVPSLAARRPAIAETLPIDEMLFRPDDAAALRETLAAILADPARRERLSNLGRARAEELRFDWEEETLRALDEGLGGRLTAPNRAA